MLTALPPEIGNLTSLKRLSLGNSEEWYVKDKDNEGKSWVPDALKTLEAKQDRYGRCQNEIRGLPSEIGKLTNLEELDLSDIQLEALPPEIGNLTNLEILDVDSNLLTAVPAEIGNLANLRRLSLNHNPLAKLPPEIRKLNTLLHWDGDP